jgi:hypothetical protein
LGFFPDTIAASLAGVTVQAAWLVTLDFTSGPMRLWRGDDELVTNDAQKWTGMGVLGAIDGIEQAINGQAPEATFTLSAISPEILRLARDEFLPEVYGRTAYVSLQFFGVEDEDDPDNQRPLDYPFPCWAGRMLKPTFSYDESGACSVAVSAESLFSLRSRPNAAMYTDSDQQQRFTGDLGFAFVGSLIAKTVTWPDY